MNSRKALSILVPVGVIVVVILFPVLVYVLSQYTYSLRSHRQCEFVITQFTENNSWQEMRSSLKRHKFVIVKIDDEDSLKRGAPEHVNSDVWQCRWKPFLPPFGYAQYIIGLPKIFKYPHVCWIVVDESNDVPTELIVFWIDGEKQVYYRNNKI